MKLEIFDSEDDVAVGAASVVERAITSRPDTVLALPAGRTPVVLYRKLVAMTSAGALDWSRVRTFNLDEFVGLNGDAPESYRHFMREHLFSHINIAVAQTEFPNGVAPDLDAECVRYERAIAAAGGLDLAILGLGANGHIAFNEPAASLTGRTHRVVLHEASRIDNASRFGGVLKRVPKEALSMGIATILNARKILLLAIGKGKAETVAAMFYGGISTALPASLLQLHNQVIVMLDSAAAEKIDRQRMDMILGNS